MAIPPAGVAVTAEAITEASAEPVPTVTVARTRGGQVAVVVESTAQAPAVVYGDTAVATGLATETISDVTVASSTNPTCNSYAYATNGRHWTGPYSWNLNSTAATTIPSSAVAGGIHAMATGLGTCSNVANSASAIYQLTTSTAGNYTSSGGCSSLDSKNVVDRGVLPSGTLALTCYSWYTSTLAMITADVRFSSSVTWYTGSSVTGCSGSKFDAQGVMTHEAGHVFGLDHVAASTLQVMKPASGYCGVSQRLLGPGDLAGMKHLYP